MASKDYSFAGYQSSGFSTASGIPALQEQLSSAYQRSQEQLRTDAENMYKTEYEGNKANYNGQLGQLNAYRNADIDKINSQYDKSGNQLQSSLLSKGLGRSSLVSTLGVENENGRNAAVADKSLTYLQQENEINSNLQKLDTEYAQNVENKYVELRDQQTSDQISLQTQIAQLQASGYANYVNYIMNK